MVYLNVEALARGRSLGTVVTTLDLQMPNDRLRISACFAAQLIQHHLSVTALAIIVCNYIRNSLT